MLLCWVTVLCDLLKHKINRIGFSLELSERKVVLFAHFNGYATLSKESTLVVEAGIPRFRQV